MKGIVINDYRILIVSPVNAIGFGVGIWIDMQYAPGKPGYCTIKNCYIKTEICHTIDRRNIANLSCYNKRYEATSTGIIRKNEISFK